LTAEIEAQFAAGAKAGGMFADTEADLNVSMGKIAAVVERQWEIELRLYQSIFSRVLPPTTAAVAAGSILITSKEHSLGPPDGSAWAIQRLTVAGLATADIVAFYRGVANSGTVDGSNFINQVSGAAPAWHPGRTGLVLQPGESVVASGTGLTATQVTLTGEVIQMEQWLLPHFLL
jgi:hypothetical protein